MDWTGLNEEGPDRVGWIRLNEEELDQVKKDQIEWIGPEK